MFFRKDLFFLLCEVFAATRKPSLFVAGQGSGVGGVRQRGGTGHRGSRAAPCGAPIVEHSSSVCRLAAVVVAHGLSSSTAAGVLLGQELNPRPLHEKVGS